jgi:diketogulonate reductase-like aldo/keto reductase
VLDYAQKNDILLTAWRPLHYGELANNPPDIIKKMMTKYNKSAVQIALNWLVSQDKVITLAKTSTPEHIDENLGALDFIMDDSDIEEVRADYPDQLEESGSVPLNLTAFS